MDMLFGHSGDFTHTNESKIFSTLLGKKVERLNKLFKIPELVNNGRKHQLLSL